LFIVGITALSVALFISNDRLMANRLERRSEKMKLYRTLRRPVVTYAAETWHGTFVMKMLFEYLKGKL
jgi:hypothetical protein